MRLSYDNWFCCSVDNFEAFELCKIKRRKHMIQNLSIIL